MSVSVYDKETGKLTTVASGMQVWEGTATQHENAVNNGTMPNNCLVAIKDGGGSDAWTNVTGLTWGTGNSGTITCVKRNTTVAVELSFTHLSNATIYIIRGLPQLILPLIIVGQSIVNGVAKRPLFFLETKGNLRTNELNEDDLVNASSITLRFQYESLE